MNPLEAEGKPVPWESVGSGPGLLRAGEGRGFLELSYGLVTWKSPFPFLLKST